MNRSPRLLGAAALVVGAGLLTGCQTSPGTAANVGSDKVTTSQLSGLIDRAITNKQAKQTYTKDKAAFTRLELNRLVNSVLIRKLASSKGVTVTEGDLTNAINNYSAQAQQQGGAPLEQQAADNGVPKQDLRNFVRDVVLAQKIGDKLVADQQIDLVHAAHILVKDKKTADSILAKVKANPAQFAALAKKYSTDTGSKNSGGDLGTQTPDTFVAPFAAALKSGSEGSFVEVQTQFGWHVIHIIKKQSTSYAQASAAQRASLAQVRQQLVAKALSAEAATMKVRVNPRYGKWDPKTDSVVATTGGPASSSPTPSAG